METTKICTNCKSEKEFIFFNFTNKSKTNRKTICKSCEIKKNSEYRKSKNGVITRIYESQKYCSKKRGHPSPSYTKKELKQWLINNKEFHLQYDKWVDSGYIKDLKPSVDRIDNYLPYTMDNIQIVSWKENRYNSYLDRISGKFLTGQEVVVMQFDLNDNYIKSYHSAHEAERKTNIFFTSIINCCKYKQKTAGGFKWKYFN